jgi:5-methylcytosine-specific restriction endonuclease McrA
METKTCTKCFIEKPFSDFYKAKLGKYGLTSICKTCSNAATKIWNDNNKERVKENQRKYVAANREKVREKDRKYKHTHRELVNERSKIYKQTHPEKVKKYKDEHREQDNLRARKRYAKNIEKERQRSREKYIRNKAQKQEYQKKYFAERPGLRQERKRTRRAREKQAEGNITKKEWNELVDRFNHTCLRCGRTNIKLTLDHVIPLTCGGSHTIDNAQPLCGSCNSIKHTNIIDYRQQAHPD